MPTVLSHIAVPLAARLGAGKNLIPGPVAVTGLILCILPDVDVITFRLGIPYAAGLGHRGFSHSLLFAGLVSLVGSLLLKALKVPFRKSYWFLFLAAASHGILDAFTNGGYGIAFFWPWSETRYFAPVQMIQVSPLSISRFFTKAGARVLTSEIKWVWAPLVLVGAAIFLFRKTCLRQKPKTLKYP